jgi:hypothetical protein
MDYVLGRVVRVRNGGFTLRIQEDARKSVVFFGKKTVGGIEYRGTGFLAYFVDGDVWCPYLVTCRHVAAHLRGEFFLRLNLKDVTGDAPGSIEHPVESADWSFHPDESVDLAACPLALGVEIYDHLYYPVDRVAVRENVWTGDPINIVGLFRLHQGERKMMPIVHTGNVALLADASERVPITDRTTGVKTLAEAYLVEAQTLEGLSGSPVFVREIVPVAGARNGSKGMYGLFGDLWLLGLYSGAWDGRPGEILANDRSLHGLERVPIGIGIVVPGDTIKEFIVSDPKLTKFRSFWRGARDKHRAAKSVSASTDAGFSAPQSNDENPTHLEDFKSLLNAAARKPELKD